jgi:micrococcal nuclease
MVRRVRSALGVCAVVTIVVVVAVVLRDRGGAGLPPDVGTVDWVVDGDTVDIEIGGRTERVRLIGIDTPEMNVDEGAPECFAPEARAFLEDLLPVGIEIRLVRDIVGRDDYGRLLAYVYRRSDELFVNEAIVANGFARPLTIAPNDAFTGEFVSATRAAKEVRAGLWAACAG